MHSPSTQQRPVLHIKSALDAISKAPCTGWRRHIGCFIFIGHFPQKSPKTSGFFAEHKLRLKASYGSSPPCSLLQETATISKEPCSLSKEPCTLSKEPCTLYQQSPVVYCKKPQLYQTSPVLIKKDPKSTKRALSSSLDHCTYIQSTESCTPCQTSPVLYYTRPELYQKSPELCQKRPTPSQKSPVLYQKRPIFSQKSPVLYHQNPVLYTAVHTCCIYQCTCNICVYCAVHTSAARERSNDVIQSPCGSTGF